MGKAQRVFVFSVVVVAVLAILLGRLFFLQVVQGYNYQEASEENRTRLATSPALRGTIYDREGVVLAKDLATYSVKLTPEHFDPAKLPLLAQITGMPVDEIQAKLEENNLPDWEPFTLRTGLGEEVVQKVEEQRLDLPGISVSIEPQRSYPYDNLFAHLVGYTGNISALELNRLESSGYTGADTIGKTGLEKAYEDWLKGEKGKQILEVNAIGQPVRVLNEIEQIPGDDMTLSIDLKLQQQARQIMVDNQMNGSIICMNPQTGAILAMVSTPDFNPNDFVKGISQKEYETLTASNALIPKATQDRFPPGSTFKVVTTAAALEEGVIDPETYSVFCPGYIDVGGHRFYCWQTSGHGTQNLIDAIANSCNVFFYTLSLEVGPERLAKWAGILGLDEYTGVDLPDEAKGVIPTPAWKWEQLEEPWYPGDTMNMGIGQGDVAVTPLALATTYAAIANGGKLLTPYLVEEIRSPDGTILKNAQTTVRAEVPFSQRTVDILRQGMVKATTLGTTQQVKPSGISVAAKTGTALITSDKQDIWICAYAPVENPQILVLVMNEYSTLIYGSYLAPFAGQLLNTYFSETPTATATPTSTLTP
ncbi:MAG: penicillin-binding protein 2 [Coprothermobacterota bacterium]|nr:penicillin-binding protein 2 [Coprothermobacterota bacterium]